MNRPTLAVLVGLLLNNLLLAACGPMQRWSRDAVPVPTPVPDTLDMGSRVQVWTPKWRAGNPVLTAVVITPDSISGIPVDAGSYPGLGKPPDVDSAACALGKADKNTYKAMYAAEHVLYTCPNCRVRFALAEVDSTRMWADSFGALFLEAAGITGAVAAFTFASFALQKNEAQSAP